MKKNWLVIILTSLHIAMHIQSAEPITDSIIFSVIYICANMHTTLRYYYTALILHYCSVCMLWSSAADETWDQWFTGTCIIQCTCRES